MKVVEVELDSEETVVAEAGIIYWMEIIFNKIVILLTCNTSLDIR
ncbi:MAG: hypothetical protein CI948_2395 [Halanaerobium sp.]|jgi:hypothetical protein|nr:hypothetical protein [Halanaerobium congolense]PUU88151.1 MAG: hypothetical protein CI948_2395 [Halanaerobium sp.]